MLRRRRGGAREFRLGGRRHEQHGVARAKWIFHLLDGVRHVDPRAVHDEAELVATRRKFEVDGPVAFADRMKRDSRFVSFVERTGEAKRRGMREKIFEGNALTRRRGFFR